MTTGRLTFVFCDGCEKTGPFGTNKADAREWLWELWQWQTVDGKDFCPECITQYSEKMFGKS